MIEGQVSFFEPLPKEVTKAWYAARAIEELPKDVLNACDQIRAQNKEIGQLRHDLTKANRVNKILGVEKKLLLALLSSAVASAIVSALAWYLIQLFARIPR